MPALATMKPIDVKCAPAAQFGIFLFFAAWCLVMTLFVIFLLPETKGVPIEEMVVVWRKHW